MRTLLDWRVSSLLLRTDCGGIAIGECFWSIWCTWNTWFLWNTVDGAYEKPWASTYTRRDGWGGAADGKPGAGYTVGCWGVAPRQGVRQQPFSCHRLYKKQVCALGVLFGLPTTSWEGEPGIRKMVGVWICFTIFSSPWKKIRLDAPLISALRTFKLFLGRQLVRVPAVQTPTRVGALADTKNSLQLYQGAKDARWWCSQKHSSVRIWIASEALVSLYLLSCSIAVLLEPRNGLSISLIFKLYIRRFGSAGAPRHDGGWTNPSAGPPPISSVRFKWHLL